MVEKIFPTIYDFSEKHKQTYLKPYIAMLRIVLKLNAVGLLEFFLFLFIASVHIINQKNLYEKYLCFYPNLSLHQIYHLHLHLLF